MKLYSLISRRPHTPGSSPIFLTILSGPPFRVLFTPAQCFSIGVLRVLPKCSTLYTPLFSLDNIILTTCWWQLNVSLQPRPLYQATNLYIQLPDGWVYLSSHPSCTLNLPCPKKPHHFSWSSTFTSHTSQKNLDSIIFFPHNQALTLQILPAKYFSNLYLSLQT